MSIDILCSILTNCVILWINNFYHQTNTWKCTVAQFYLYVLWKINAMVTVQKQVVYLSTNIYITITNSVNKGANYLTTKLRQKTVHW